MKLFDDFLQIAPELKLFSCTNVAIDSGASKDKVFIVAGEYGIYGRPKLIAIELDITDAGVFHQKSGAEFTVDDLKNLGSKVFETSNTYDVSFGRGMFFKQISFDDLQTKVDALKLSPELQSHEVLEREYHHCEAMKLFAAIELKDDEVSLLKDRMFNIKKVAPWRILP